MYRMILFKICYCLNTFTYIGSIIVNIKEPQSQTLFTHETFNNFLPHGFLNIQTFFTWGQIVNVLPQLHLALSENIKIWFFLVK